VTLARDLGMTASKTMDVFKQLGCTVQSGAENGATVRQARLMAPLQFPKPPRRRILK